MGTKESGDDYSDRFNKSNSKTNQTLSVQNSSTVNP